MTPAFDVVLVGGGGAGLRAAIAIADGPAAARRGGLQGLSDAEPHRVGGGGGRGRDRPDDSLDEHCYDTVSGGDWLGDQDAIEAFVSEAPQELLRLEHWGAPGAASPTAALRCARSAA